jgi:hypothetical protein
MQQMTLPVDGQLEKLFRYIAKGLLWHHWKVRLTTITPLSLALFPTIS